MKNLVTGKVLSEDEFWALDVEERDADEWARVVTKLDWLENSLVTLGSNRKAKVEYREVVKNYIAEKQEIEEPEEQPEEQPEVKEEEPKEEPVEPEVKEEVEEPEVKEEEVEEEVKEEEPENTEQPEAETEQEEEPVAEEDAENAESTEASVVVKQSDVEEVNKHLKMLAETVLEQREQIKDLNAKLDKIPLRKGINKPVQQESVGAIGQLLKGHGYK